MSAADEATLYQLAAGYARAIDRNEPDALAVLFMPDAVIEGKGFRIEGIEAIRGIPAMLRQRYLKTLHVLHQQTCVVTGDSAGAETHCTANHVTDLGGGRASNLIWVIRYQDGFTRSGGQWRFARRQLILDWTETREVQIPGKPG